MERTSDLMFLSQQDVVDLTGHSRAAIQMRWLRANAIPFLIGGDGQPKVARQTVLEKLDPSNADSDQKGVAMPCLAEITDNWDKVSEALMAELMGVTARALQGRRPRGVIPADVWREIDGRVMYSLKRYEQWLDGCWPAFEAPASAKPRKLRQKRNPQNNGFRLV